MDEREYEHPNYFFHAAEPTKPLPIASILSAPPQSKCLQGRKHTGGKREEEPKTRLDHQDQSLIVDNLIHATLSQICHLQSSCIFKRIFIRTI